MTKYKLLTQLFHEVKTLIQEKTDKRLLGRWTLTRCPKQEENKIYLANMDHCGDCGKIIIKENPINSSN